MQEQTAEKVENYVEEQMKGYALIPVAERDMSPSVFKQKCLFEIFNLPPSYMLSHRIEKRDDGTYALIKRATPLEPIDLTLEDRPGVSGKMTTIAEKSGFDATFTNHDHDDVLFNALHCSVEVKELQ